MNGVKRAEGNLATAGGFGARLFFASVLVLGALLVLGSPARPDNIGIQTGIGPSFSPTMFYLQAAGDVRFHRTQTKGMAGSHEFSFVPMLQFAARSGAWFLMPTVGVRYTYDLPVGGKGSDRAIRPSVDFGLGLDVAHGGGATSTGFAIPFGFGVDYMITREWGLGTHLYINNRATNVAATRISWMFGTRFKI